MLSSWGAVVRAFKPPSILSWQDRATSSLESGIQMPSEHDIIPALRHFLLIVTSAPDSTEQKDRCHCQGKGSWISVHALSLWGLGRELYVPQAAAITSLSSQEPSPSTSQAAIYLFS